MCAPKTGTGGFALFRRSGAGAVGTARLLTLALVCLLGCAAFASAATAAEAPPELLWQVPEDQAAGEEAGRMSNVRGVAANPNTGNVFVADLNNARIDEFTIWGEFVKAWGFGVRPGSPDTELQTCTIATGCEKGVSGSGPGQLTFPRGVAVDSTGAVYVYESGNSRVTKYDEDGNFLLMFGGNVNKTTGAEVCTAASGDECGAGDPGSDPGFFENGTVGNFIDVSPTDTIYVGDKGRIQEFNPDGTFKSQTAFSGAEAPPAEASVWGLAVDPVSGDVYVSTNSAGGLYRVDPTTGVFKKIQDKAFVGSEEKTFPQVPAGLAVDSEGNLYVVDHRETFGFDGPFEVLKFDSTGKCLICGAKFAQPDNLFTFGKALMGLATSDACEIPGDDLYVTVFAGGVAYVQSYGPAPQDIESCPPPEVAPEITDQYATTVGIEDAEVQAKINPNFWNDTVYYVQYGPQACLDSNWTTGCSTEPLPPGALLTDKVLGNPVPTGKVLLDGLAPDTIYHYRFVTESSGGGPVVGIGGTEAEEGDSSTFRTFPTPLSQPPCPNEVFRTGASAFLPDCRAYEMVSPVDKNGGDILTQQSIKEYPAELNLSSSEGGEVTFSSETAFANSVSAPYSNQYIAKRDPKAGWQTEAISPPREKLFRPAGTAQLYELDLQYKRFSPDLDQAWLMQEADPPLDEECGVPGYINWYKRDNATGTYEAVTTKKPPAPPAGKKPLEYFSEVQGVSDDGVHTVYRANDQLPVDTGVAAANVAGYQLYEHVSDPGGGCGETRLVSVLPDGSANPTTSSVGTAAVGTAGATWIESRENLVHNAVSADGSRIYWTAAGEGPGALYVRANGSQTIKVSVGSSARFWHAAEDGSVAYFTEGETLRRFIFPGPGSTVVASQVSGLLGASEDGSRAYFVSKADLDGGAGPAKGGQPNLYLFSNGATTFIATLSTADISGSTPSTANPAPVGRLAHVSEDGSQIVFASNQSLTGQDNIDVVSGLPDSAVYLYEVESATLRCISCNFTGARPTGTVVEGASRSRAGFASKIPPWKNQFHAPRVISQDGSTVYFESYERLVPRDTNGKQDVYQWRRAGGETECEAAGAELFNPAAGGCISLISSGTGGDASFVDSTPDGSDVFFKTPASLLPQDPGRVDLYDARVGGGFPIPPVPPDPKAPCADGCPPPPVTPPNSGIGGGQFPIEKCKPLQKKAKKAAAKARALRKQAANAQGAKAKALRKKAKKQTKKANRAGAKAQACFTGVRGK